MSCEVFLRDVKVRLEGYSGPDLLRVSCSSFDPAATSIAMHLAKRSSYICAMPVRPMRASELSHVQALARQLWPGEPLYEFRDEQVFVWEREQGCLGGFASVSIRPWVQGSQSEPCPHVEAWFVESDLRHGGVGRALMVAIEDWCRERGYRELTSDAELRNKVSLRAHSAVGFKPTVRIQYFKKAI